jgi:hypothetical protein
MEAIDQYTQGDYTAYVYVDECAPNPAEEFDYVSDEDILAWEQGEYR